MSETFRKIVNAPHKAFGRARKKLQKMTPESGLGEALRIGGVGITGLSQFLLWAGKYVALDNHLLRKLEQILADMKVGKTEKGKDKKLSSFMKKNPNFSAHLIYYLIATMSFVGAKYGPQAAEKVSEWKRQATELVVGDGADDEYESEQQFQPGTYGAYLDKMQSITPYLIADLIAKEGVKTNDQGLHVPYKCSRGVWTIGFGSTRLKDGSEVTANTPPITTDEAYELARWHLEEHESFFMMYCYDVGVDAVDVASTREAFSLGSVLFNSGTNVIENGADKNHRERMMRLRDDFAKYGYAITDEMVRQRFAEFPVVAPTSFGQKWLDGKSEAAVADNLGNFLKGGKGIWWRRWLEAGVLLGEITPTQLLDCPVGGMYEFFAHKKQARDAFWIEQGDVRTANRQTYKDFREWLKNPISKHGKSIAHWKKARDFLPADILQLCMAGRCELGAPMARVNREQIKKQNEIAVQTYVVGYDERYNAAITAYRAKNYVIAASEFEDMIEDYPDNALLRNDLADTYNKLGRHEDAVKQAKEILHRIGDKSQYAAAQYNAGLAYEKMGNLERALANYKLSVANGNRRVQKDVARIEKKLGRGNKKRVAFNDANAAVKNALDTAERDVAPFVVSENLGARRG